MRQNFHIKKFHGTGQWEVTYYQEVMNCRLSTCIGSCISSWCGHIFAYSNPNYITNIHTTAFNPNTTYYLYMYCINAVPSPIYYDQNVYNLYTWTSEESSPVNSTNNTSNSTVDSTDENITTNVNTSGSCLANYEFIHILIFLLIIFN